MRNAVAVVSDDHRFSEKVVRLFNNDPAFNVFWLGGSQVRLALRSSAPQLAVIDARLSSAIDLCEEISTAGGPGIVLVRVPASGNAAVDALAAGARGIVYESSPLKHVLKALRVVERGQLWAPRHVVAQTWMRFKTEMTARRARDAAFAQTLSIREREVLRFAAAGLGNKEVADRLAISQATVKVHLSHIFQKLGVRGRGKLAAAYYSIGRSS